MVNPVGMEGLPLGEVLRDAALAKSQEGRGRQIQEVRDWLIGNRWAVATPATNTLTADDVHNALDALGYGDGDTRWSANILRGWPAVAPTDRFVASRRPSRHSAPTRMWAWR